MILLDLKMHMEELRVKELVLNNKNKKDNTVLIFLTPFSDLKSFDF